jgi:excisionase family DNA binding protein
MRKRTIPVVPTPASTSPGKTSRPGQPVVIDQLLTVPEAAARLGIGKSKLYEMLNANELPYVEIPGRGECVKRISALTLNTWIKARETVKHAPVSGSLPETVTWLAEQQSPRKSRRAQ